MLGKGSRLWVSTLEVAEHERTRANVRLTQWELKVWHRAERNERIIVYVDESCVKKKGTAFA